MKKMLAIFVVCLLVVGGAAGGGYLFFSNAAAVDAADATTATADAAAYAASTTAYVATADADADATATTVVVDDVDDVDATPLTGAELAAILAGGTPIVSTTTPAAVTVDTNVTPTPPAPTSLADAMARENAIVATREFIQDGFVISGEAMAVFSSFDDGFEESDYEEIYFPAVGGETVTVTLLPGQVLYLSAGIYTIFLPDGEFLVRGFGETLVANDYFFMPGDYTIVGWPTPTTPERGTFSAIGGRVINSASMMAELDASFAAPLLMPGPGESLREMSQHGRAKEASYSWFFMEDGTLFETRTAALGGRVNVSLN